MQQKINIQPRLIRLRDAPQYLATNINYFNKVIRPSLPFVLLGKHGIAFDRVDLDLWIEQNKGRGEKRPVTEGISLWDENACQVSTNVTRSGILTKQSLDDEFAKALELATSKKLKKF